MDKKRIESIESHDERTSAEPGGLFEWTDMNLLKFWIRCGAYDSWEQASKYLALARIRLDICKHTTITILTTSLKFRINSSRSWQYYVKFYMHIMSGCLLVSFISKWKCPEFNVESVSFHTLQGLIQLLLFQRDVAYDLISMQLALTQISLFWLFQL